jgi:uncharacterized protein YkuJ
MKNEIINMIKILGIGTHELIIDFDLGSIIFNSIEWDINDNKIYLHTFEENDFDIAYEFDDLDLDAQMEIYITLARILYN